MSSRSAALFSSGKRSAVFSLYANLLPFTAYDLLVAACCLLPRLEQAPALATGVGLLRWHWRQGMDESGQALPVGGDCLSCGK